MKFDFTSINSDIKNGLANLKNKGLSGILTDVRDKVTRPGLAYNSWYRNNHEADEEELSVQRTKHFDYEPLISILVPVYMTPEYFLRSMIESVQSQTYAKWELCLVDGSQLGNEPSDEPDAESIEKDTYDIIFSVETERIIKEYMKNESRIKYRLMKENKGISGNTNVAIEMSEGEYIMVLNHDDVLTEDALYSLVESLQDIQYDCVYSDEDCMSEDGSLFSEPHFKPDYSPDLLNSYNYIGHFFAVKIRVALAVGGFHSEYDGVQDYDFVLRTTEAVMRDEIMIKHIKRVLYHVRIHNRSAQIAYQEKKKNADIVGKSALEAHLNRLNYYAMVSHTDTSGVYKVHYETPGNPLVTIVVTGTSDVDNISRSMDSFYNMTRYSNFEVIIVDSFTGKSSTGSAGMDSENIKQLSNYYHKLCQIRKNVKIVPFDGNSSPKARNKGASYANGKYILFVDGNIWLSDPYGFGDMLGICMRQDVGVVGGCICNSNDVIEEKGILIGVNGVADRRLRGIRRNERFYQGYTNVNFDVSAVSASVMLVKKDEFKSRMGFSNEFSDWLCDIDFCLKLMMDGKYIVASNAVWYRGKLTDFESRFRASDDHLEESIFRRKWKRVYESGDIFYNINFGQNGVQYALNEEIKE